MNGFQRYAVYYAPPPGPLAAFGAAWLGWDPVTGRPHVHPVVDGLPRPVSALTATPRKYGFHATIKPPFRLADGVDVPWLHARMFGLAETLPPVLLDGLALERLGGFLALTPLGHVSALTGLAADVVAQLDDLRAPLNETELARRLATPLTDVQRALLARWGYPYVMDEFRFHMTLTGDLPPDEARAAMAALAPLVGPLLPRPFRIDQLCLFGEAADGRFHLLHRYTLSG